MASIDNEIELCETQWNKINFDLDKSNQDKISQWQAYQKKCDKSDMYEYGLMRFYTQNGEYDKAKNEFNNIQLDNSPIKKFLEKQFIDIDYYHVGQSTNFPLSKLEEILNRYSKLVKLYPDWHGGYEGVGSVLVGIGNYEEAITYLNKGADISQTALAYQMLGIAYMEVGKYQESINAINKAYARDKQLIRNREFMLAAATSYYHLKEYDKAVAMIETLVSHQPELKNDEKVLQIARKIIPYLKK